MPQVFINLFEVGTLPCKDLSNCQSQLLALGIGMLTARIVINFDHIKKACRIHRVDRPLVSY